MAKEINPSRGVMMMSSSGENKYISGKHKEVMPYDPEDVEFTAETTSRLAVQNMDWDRIKAVDLLLVFNSFKPASGTVYSVKIYPSEFGKEKMKEDNLKGPQELKSAESNGTGRGNFKRLSQKEQKRVMNEKLRQYQLNRLNYYYAVVEFDSPETANHIYTQCDGVEYLKSGIQLDLRFIPDGMEFCEREVKESANHVPDDYEPTSFVNTALRQSSVECTWDENPPERYEMLNKKYKVEDLAEFDFKAYLASDTDDDDDDRVKHSDITTKIGREKKSLNTASAEMSQTACSCDDEKVVPMNDDIQRYRELLLGGSDKKAEESKNTRDSELKDVTKNIIKNKKRGRGVAEMSTSDLEREMKREQQKENEHEAAHVSKKKKQKKKKKTERSENDEITEENFVQAFSNNDVPEQCNVSDLLDGREEKDSIKAKSAKGKEKRKKKRKPQQLEEGEGSITEPDLDLLVMNSPNGGKKHYNMKEIAEYEAMMKIKRKHKLKKSQLKEMNEDLKDILERKDATEKLMKMKKKQGRGAVEMSAHDLDCETKRERQKENTNEAVQDSEEYGQTNAVEAILEENQRQIGYSNRTIHEPIERRAVGNENQE